VDDERLVESQLVAEALVLLGRDLARRGAAHLGEHELNGVAGQEKDKRRDQQRNA
jgi:hypothetical protein